tara:strand:- start:1921 stop:2829 length:909 start_codon:yes stop_codon:yes gene_type:complete
MSELANMVDSLRLKIFNDSTINLNTSGTSGQSKIVKKNAREIFDKCKRSAEYDSSDIFGFLYNLETWAAVSVVLYCIKNNIKPYRINLDLPLHAQLLEVSLLSITPTFLKLISMNLEGKKIKNIKKVILGGEYSDQDTINLCKSLFPNSRIITIYSSTETGDIATSSDMIEGFSKKKFKDYSFDNNGCLIKEGVNTGDVWKLCGERYRFVGRIDSCIKIAGNLVSINSLEKKIKNLATIDDCVCQVLDAPVIGKSYKLLYVGELTKEAVRSELKTLLKKYEMPVLIKKVENIGFGKNFKKNR